MAKPDPTAAETQWSAITHSPLPFILVCAVIAVIIWRAMSWRYESQIEKLRVDRDHYRDLHERDVKAATSAPIPKLEQYATKPKSEAEAKEAAEEEISEASPSTVHTDRLRSGEFANNEILSLVKSLEGRTDYQVQIMTKNRVGHHVSVAGTIIEVSTILNKVSVSISLEEKWGRDCYMVFNSDFERLKLLNRGELIMVSGKIDAINRYGVTLIECQYLGTLQ